MTTFDGRDQVITTTAQLEELYPEPVSSPGQGQGGHPHHEGVSCSYRRLRRSVRLPPTAAAALDLFATW